VPCRIRHHPGVSEPTLEVAIEPYLVALGLLREYGFTQQCSRWQADPVSLTIGRSDAPESFRNAWDSWAAVTPKAAGMITEFERPDFQLASKAVGLKNVNKMVCDVCSYIPFPLNSSISSNTSMQLLSIVIDLDLHSIHSAMSGQ